MINENIELNPNLFYFFHGLVLIYSSWRLFSAISPFCFTQKTNKYLTRLIFRVLFIFHVACNLVIVIVSNTVKNESKKCMITHLLVIFTQFFNSASLIILSRSVLDFSQFTCGPKVFYQKSWLQASIPPMLIYFFLVCYFHIKYIHKSNPSNLLIQIPTFGIYIAFNIALVAVPGLYFIYHLHKSDIIKEYGKTVISGIVFFIFVIVYDITVYIVAIFTFIAKKKLVDLALSKVEVNTIRAFSVLNILICLVTCLTQDMIDLILYRFGLNDKHASEGYEDSLIQGRNTCKPLYNELLSCQ
ncbi:hypothetical protein TRFO_31350 [Tritrichomonas foetus]|uniref:THH1/TOM1/TOM3 domain-containing protein n=1 Tax=Tritrichomonas foetus TaxID=1144522 RepID=A0A1J4JRJ2_9EUKA|nr:hypothetical protein TRFO_31350 [Tritrichomonas foetus]|eukprot:OHT01737.1 hypothetical protein TRFO_31350 [Tritrichomonas foetus]